MTVGYRLKSSALSNGKWSVRCCQEDSLLVLGLFSGAARALLLYGVGGVLVLLRERHCCAETAEGAVCCG